MQKTVNGQSTQRYLAFRNIRKKYGSFTAVDDVSLDIARGEFVALLGPSGCGKTTLLRAIAGLVTPTSGDIELCGKSLLTVPVERRDIGMVFQSYALFPHMTVAENVAFGLQMRRAPKANIPGQVEDALALVRMNGLKDRYPGQMSGGQQQRIALARALVTKPRVLLLDEPLAALDAKLREAMQFELRQLQQNLGITTIFVTHDQQEALAMADRVAVMNAGRVEQFDTPRVMYDGPATPFVAEFIGQMNQWPARLLDRRDAGGRVRCECGDLEVATIDAKVPVGGGVTLMVRPEKMKIGAKALPDGSKNVLHGRLKGLMFSGEKTFCYVETCLGLITTVVQNQTTGVDVGLASGNDVVLTWRAEDTIAFSSS
ncbi:ABC transporter ATP-binding protein (plasmid) [Aminobacter sp. SR38]|jgi:putative spermidine/putrescine transport system ATP-binding protein|uniref:ABC transporter ATP-binding protein n=1 Tax=Aminobacter sp. SR38 TaxID=2774562 RepID=UPI0017846F6E|nr:ABC transporter ATP-binding protein [Aminobacter sp. SR38]QOF75714.1 ABC transporter ATP-binding protein [Aminobacter sp. SR38]